MNAQQPATNNDWMDFNNAQVQQDYDLIPKGTLAKVRLTLNPGGHDEPHMGWSGGWATQGDSGAVYLKAEYTVLTGPYAKRKVWSLIGLHSPKGPNWANMGRSYVRSVLCSARGIQQDDNSPQAVLARRLQNFGEMDGMEFVARIDVEKDADDEPTNVIKHVVTPDHKQYQALMSEMAATQGQQPIQQQNAQQPMQQSAQQQSPQSYQQPGHQQSGYQQNPDFQFQQPTTQNQPQEPNQNWQD